MPFATPIPPVTFTRPLFCGVLANTLISTVPGVSAAGPTPELTLLTPVLDSELIVHGAITSRPVRPNTPTGCPTPASITRAMVVLSGVPVVFVNAGLVHLPVVPCLDVYGEAGKDPRTGDAVPAAAALYQKGLLLGEFFSQVSDLLVLGECVPGGTTTALCVLRALGYHASVSSSFVKNPIAEKEAIAAGVLSRLSLQEPAGPLEVVRAAGDPMMAVAAGIASSYKGSIFLAGGTQMLAVAAVIRGLDHPVPPVVTTCYVRDDPSAGVMETAAAVGATVIIIDPGFGDIGHHGLARYCIGDVKEGMGAGGALFLAHLMGHTPEEIRQAVIETVSAYT